MYLLMYFHERSTYTALQLRNEKNDRAEKWAKVSEVVRARARASSKGAFTVASPCCLS